MKKWIDKWIIWRHGFVYAPKPPIHIACSWRLWRTKLKYKWSRVLWRIDMFIDSSCGEQRKARWTLIMRCPEGSLAVWDNVRQ